MIRPPTVNSKQGVPPVSRDSHVLHAGNVMERDTAQSRRLHEPASISSHTDPITGNDVMGTAGILISSMAS
jgi:hypothetical protein